MKVGIDALSVYTPRYYLELAELAVVRGVPPEKYLTGIGQERMAVPAPGEDIVTMAANACLPLLEGQDLNGIDMLLLATESGIDQSKAAAIYVHRLLGLAPHCQAFEFKQACYGSTAALQMALLQVARHPECQVLVVATDIARYGLGTAGEPTQGAGAVAMRIRAEPRLLAIEPDFACCTEDAMDFWRPNYRDEALVDGKLSMRVYVHILEECWRRHQALTGLGYADFARFCYHQPFTRMAEKAHERLAGLACGHAVERPLWWPQIADSLLYGRLMGNSYTGSLYVALASLLETGAEALDGERLGLFSYGSGCTGAFFAGTVQPGYRAALRTAAHRALFAERQALPIAAYETMYRFRLPADGSAFLVSEGCDTGAFRLAGIDGHQRQYERVRNRRPVRATEPAAEAGAEATERRYGNSLARPQ